MNIYFVIIKYFVALIVCTQRSALRILVT